MPTALPFVSIIVPALGSDGLGDCLRSLLALHYPADRREILVVGADASGATGPITRQYPFTYLRAVRPNVNVARNVGIDGSRGEILAFTDPDCVATTTWLNRIVEGFCDPRTGAVAGAIIPYPPRTAAERYMARRRSHSQERPLSHAERPFAMTPNLAFRRDALAAIGSFDTRFPGGGWEDADFCWRLAEQTHYRLEYAPRAVVFHRYRSTMREFLVQQYRYGYGLGVLCHKYRAELPPEWSQRAGSLSDLVRALTSIAAVRTTEGKDRVEPVQVRCFELLRQIGQRSGYWAASLAPFGKSPTARGVR